jgi:hypothetical protein
MPRHSFNRLKLNEEGDVLSNYDFNDGQGAQQTGVMPPQPGYQQPPMYQQQMPQQGYGYGMQRPGLRGFGRRQGMSDTETKPFFLTSEFGVSVITAILIAITAASSHAFGAWRAWILITAIVVAYNVSRGLAKAGTRSHASDPRDDLDLSRSHGENQHSHQR